MRVLGLLLLLAAMGLYGLSALDRRSPAALALVEQETRLGAPLWAPVAGVGAVLVLASLRRRRPEAPPPAPAPRRVQAKAPSGEEQDWLAEARQRAASLPMGAGAEIQLNPGAQVPLELSLRGFTPERVRAAVDLFATFLVDLPTPPRARIRFVDCGPAPVPRHKQVQGALAAKLASGRFSAVGTSDAVELVFTQPDPRWTARGGES